MRSVFDRSDREDVRLHQPRCVKRFRFRSTRVRGQHSPLSLLCITMILRVRRNFFEITTFPNNFLLGQVGPMLLPWFGLLRPVDIKFNIKVF